MEQVKTVPWYLADTDKLMVSLSCEARLCKKREEVREELARFRAETR